MPPLPSTVRRLPGASCSYQLTPPAFSSCSRAQSRGIFKVFAVNQDPENLFKGIPTQEGLINRRLMGKEMERNKQFAAEIKTVQSEERKQVLLRRELRSPPTDNAELIEYLLSSEAEDIDYEVARCRPRFTPAFFKTLDSILGRERFAAKPDQDRVAELETLRQYIEEGVEAVDAAISKTTSAVDRMKKLLGAKDKKAMILEMAANNEIDHGLMDLLQQNIDAAKMAEQVDAANFMEKVKNAAAKYLVTVESSAPARTGPTLKDIKGGASLDKVIEADFTNMGPSPSQPAPAQSAPAKQLIINPGASAPAGPAKKLIL